MSAGRAVDASNILTVDEAVVLLDRTVTRIQENQKEQDAFLTKEFLEYIQLGMENIRMHLLELEEEERKKPKPEESQPFIQPPSYARDVLIYVNDLLQHFETERASLNPAKIAQFNQLSVFAEAETLHQQRDESYPRNKRTLLIAAAVIAIAILATLTAAIIHAALPAAVFIALIIIAIWAPIFGIAFGAMANKKNNLSPAEQIFNDTVSMLNKVKSTLFAPLSQGAQQEPKNLPEELVSKPLLFTC